MVHVDSLRKLIIRKKCASRAVFCFSAPSPLGRVSRVLEALQAVQLLPSPRLVTRGETQLPPPNSSPNGPKQGLSLLLKQVLSGGVLALLYSVARQGVQTLAGTFWWTNRSPAFARCHDTPSNVQKHRYTSESSVGGVEAGVTTETLYSPTEHARPESGRIIPVTWQALNYDRFNVPNRHCGSAVRMGQAPRMPFSG